MEGLSEGRMHGKGDGVKDNRTTTSHGDQTRPLTAGEEPGGIDLLETITLPEGEQGDPALYQ